MIGLYCSPQKALGRGRVFGVVKIIGWTKMDRVAVWLAFNGQKWVSPFSTVNVNFQQ